MVQAPVEFRIGTHGAGIFVGCGVGTIILNIKRFLYE